MVKDNMDESKDSRDVVHQFYINFTVSSKNQEYQTASMWSGKWKDGWHRFIWRKLLVYTGSTSSSGKQSPRVGKLEKLLEKRSFFLQS